ncbi:hypothetical protein SYNPS1DRAFT_26717 [Syncephalis pseudoplumigaleata]|uniref:SET domain-containing protein n=1 Tax=Syncephalis pseudoplumigaleata TaxID=1712513 RepID=A0A4P9Z7F6_9FUNG|nr:hypothetical protein SYNPS1DRAFT_26717 [Syncephalis pseudoplumigaleata]|eukprot:RKP27640.1 hypothetical protein SYNPS1DRAFT_26717 [Syncephalis pseudoplumigaleata]
MAYHLAVATTVHGTASEQWPYLAVLPRNFATLPICYPPSLQQLLPPSVQEQSNTAQTKQRCISMGLAEWYAAAAEAEGVIFSNMKAYYDRKTACYTITTENTFLRGQQAFISYGPHDNAFLLGEYGFVTADNKYNQWVVNLAEIHALVDALLVLPCPSHTARWHPMLRHMHHATDAKVAFLGEHGLIE